MNDMTFGKIRSNIGRRIDVNLTECRFSWGEDRRCVLIATKGD